MGQVVFSRLVIIALAFAATLGLASHRAFCQVLTLRTTAISENIRIDGKLDEPAWLPAIPIKNLTRVIPKEEAPSAITEIRVLVDANALYFGITCYDCIPERIVSSQLVCDSFLDPDDNIGVLDVMTDRVDSVELDKQNMFVGRISHDFWRQAFWLKSHAAGISQT
jgi:hypothetical protein